ncbi:MAG: septum formation initiator family protein [Elusimicrobiaceae bacterium]|nr:septum formation initiator family protein [Elusimicrobiaceae bacterium]
MLKKLSAKQKALLISILIIAVGSLLLGGSILNLVHNKWEVHRLTKKSRQLDVRYQQLLEEKKLLEDQNPKHMEMLARTRYDMVKPGELEFRFKNEDSH